MERNTNGPATQTTGYPLVTLVDLEGFRIGVGSKDIPHVEPEPCPADSWPAWTDVVRARCGRRHEDLHAMGVLLGDALRVVLDRVAEAPMDPDDGCGPLPELPDVRSPEEWPVEPPDGWEGDGSVGWASLPPISGGAPYEPTPEDLQDLAAWSDAVVARRWYDERGGLAEFNRLRTD
jgi:hypothetical protein